jgi:hypothetical protein
MNLYVKSNLHRKLFRNISKKISQIPREKRKTKSDFFDFLMPYKYADVPAKKTKTGAQ